MAEIFERFRGISGDARQRVIQYLVEDATSDNDALTLAELASPVEYDDLARTNARVREIDKKAYTLREYDPSGNPGKFIEEQDTTVNDGTYYVDVIYSAQNVASGSNPATSGRYATFAFEQSLETARIRQAKYGTTTYNDVPANPGVDPSNPNPASAYAFEGINANKDAYDGADIRLPIGSYSYDFYPRQTDINDNYLDTVQSLVGTVNSTAFENAAPGEILFVSATGRRRANQNDWEFNYKFEYRKNVVREVLKTTGAQPIQYDKDGHDYLWVYYTESAQTNLGTGGKDPILIARQVNVEQVYPRDDLWTKLFITLQP